MGQLPKAVAGALVLSPPLKASTVVVARTLGSKLGGDATAGEDTQLAAAPTDHEHREIRAQTLHVSIPLGERQAHGASLSRDLNHPNSNVHPCRDRRSFGPVIYGGGGRQGP